MLWDAIVQALETPNVDTLLLRRTFPQLESSLLAEWRRDVLPKWQGVRGFEWNDSKHTVRWPNGSTTRFGYCDNENDVYQYQGGEFLFIGVDELTMFALKQWQFLTSRNRCPVAGTFPNMAGATNPGNIGHAWVKALFIDKKPAPGMERPEEYDASQYAFIRATLDDNPIYANDVQYQRTLSALPTALYRAFRLGEWDLFAGQYFDCFDLRLHTRDARDIVLKPWWPRWISIDWGFKHPSAVYWHAKDGDRVITYRELHGAGLGESELGKQIAEMSQGEKIQYVFGDPSMFAKKGSANTVAEQVSESLVSAGIPSIAQADNDRIGGARLCYQMLKAELVTISKSCPKLIECIPTLIHDEDHIEDVLKVDAGEGSFGDDPYDAWRYGLKSMLGEATMPIHERIEETIDSWKADGRLTDPTSEMIRRAELASRFSRSTMPVRFGFRRH